MVGGVRLEYGGKKVLERGGKGSPESPGPESPDGELGSGKECGGGRGVGGYSISDRGALTTSREERRRRGGRAKLVEVREAGVCKGTVEFGENIQGLNISRLSWRLMTSRQLGEERLCDLGREGLLFSEREWGASVGEWGRRAGLGW